MKTQKGLWAIMKPVNKYINFAIILAILGAIGSTISLILIANILSLSLENELIVLGLEFNFYEAFSILAIFLILTFFARYYSFILSHLGAFKLEAILRTELTTHLAKIPLGKIILLGTGSVKKVLLDDVKSLHAFVADTTPMIGRSITTPIISLVALFFIDYRLALVSFSLLLIGIILLFFAMRGTEENRIKYERSQSNINKSVIEFIQAMNVVRTFDDGSSSFKRYNDSLNEYRTHLKNWFVSNATFGKTSIAVFSPLPTLLIISFCGIFWVQDGSMNFSTLMAGLLISTGIVDSFMPLMWVNNFIKKSQASALRIQEIKAIEELKYSEYTPTFKTLDISFDNVSFKYENREEYALKKLSFKVKEKTVTALVGESGAGKSTIAKLIPRFWDIQEGTIKIGNINIKDINSQTLMNTVSFVFQDNFLFNDTIENNIKMANLKASEEEIIEACKAAQIHDFIISLDKGYKTFVGDRGTNLSGGQKQRITIARAILRDTPILVLDEATAFADPENEEKIIKALSNLMKNKTVIVIAHRLSSIKNADQIIVFDEGKISQHGKHEELLCSKGVYSLLWQNYEKAQNWNLSSKGEIK